jgi:hypothetical protein
MEAASAGTRGSPVLEQVRRKHRLVGELLAERFLCLARTEHQVSGVLRLHEALVISLAAAVLHRIILSHVAIGTRCDGAPQRARYYYPALIGQHACSRLS